MYIHAGGNLGRSCANDGDGGLRIAPAQQPAAAAAAAAATYRVDQMDGRTDGRTDGYSVNESSTFTFSFFQKVAAAAAALK